MVMILAQMETPVAEMLLHDSDGDGGNRDDSSADDIDSDRNGANGNGSNATIRTNETKKETAVCDDNIVTETEPMVVETMSTEMERR